MRIRYDEERKRIVVELSNGASEELTYSNAISCSMEMQNAIVQLTRDLRRDGMHNPKKPVRRDG